MGLQPLDEFIEAGKPLGATTWMALSAAQCLTDGKNAYLICRTERDANRVSQTVIGFCARMSLGHHTASGPSWAKFKNNATLKWKAGNEDVAKVIGFTGTLFNDALWAKRAARRAEGPYDMVRAIWYVGGEFLGCAEDEEIVMDFTKEGALDFLASNPEVMPIGFDRPYKREKMRL